MIRRPPRSTQSRSSAASDVYKRQRRGRRHRGVRSERPGRGHPGAATRPGRVAVTGVLVAGGGLIGLSVAWHAAQRGLSVTVVDQAPGAGASYAAAGMLAPGAWSTAV